MVRNEGRFLITEAQILQQLGDIKDAVGHAELIEDQLLYHRRTPTVAVKTALGGAVFNELAELTLLRFGQFRRTPGRFLESDPGHAVTQKPVRVVFDLRNRKLQYDRGLLGRGVMRYSQYRQREFDGA